MVKNLPVKQETCVLSLGRKDPLEKEIANPLQYSLLEKIPWTEEPGGLQTLGLQRVRHDLATEQQQQKQEPGLKQFIPGHVILIPPTSSHHFLVS